MYGPSQRQLRRPGSPPRPGPPPPPDPDFISVGKMKFAKGSIDLVPFLVHKVLGSRPPSPAPSLPSSSASLAPAPQTYAFAPQKPPVRERRGPNPASWTALSPSGGWRLVLGHGNAVGVESRPECWGGGGSPPPFKRFPEGPAAVLQPRLPSHGLLCQSIPKHCAQRSPSTFEVCTSLLPGRG